MKKHYQLGYHPMRYCKRYKYPGFTLIETLLVIALIGILIGLTLPYLAGARDKAREVSGLSLIRGHGQILQMYSADYAGFFPVIGHPDRPTTIRVGGREFDLHYWHAEFQWVFALAEQYYDGRIGHPSLFPPGYHGDSSPFKYTESYLATSDFWAPETRTGRQQWRAVPAALTAYPSAKGLLTSWAGKVPVPGRLYTYSFPDDMLQETAFVDGSARTIVLRDFLPWMRTGEGDYPGRKTQPLGWPVLHTMHGAVGRDIE
ncbi:MAG: type II secretion system protein [Phycisphaeraceae bacterium]|nr:type II secretion system protein [Phycisphaeraceae bacterium]